MELEASHAGLADDRDAGFVHHLMLVETEAAHHAAMPREDLGRVFDGDSFQSQMINVRNKAVDGTDQPLGGVDDVRQCVLHGATSLSSVAIIDLPIGGSIEGKMLTALSRRTWGGKKAKRQSQQSRAASPTSTG